MTAVILLLCAFSIPGEVSEFDLSNGIHVISRTVPGGEVEGVSLFLVGGSRLLEDSTQGIEAFALECAMTGSERYPDHLWREMMDLTLARWSASYNYDYSRYHLKCLSEDLPLLLDGFADCLMNPQLSPPAVERVRSSQVSAASAELEDPDNRVWLVANRGFMGEGHPYLLRPEGLPGTLAAFTAEDAEEWLRRRIRAGNLVITHAGPTEPALLRDMLEGTFGAVPPGSDTIPPVPAFSFPEDTTVAETADISTAYMVVKFQAPPPGHGDQAAFSIACGVIDELLWQVLRTDNALTYAAYAGSTTSYVQNWGYMYSSTPEPERASQLMAEVFAQVAEGDAEEALVTGVANGQRTLEGIRAQSMDAQCHMLGYGHIAAGDWSLAYRLQEAYPGITPEEAGEAIARWAEGGAWGIIAGEDSNQPELAPLKGE